MKKREKRVKISLTLEGESYRLLQLLSKHTGITQGEIVDYFVKGGKKNMRNVLRDLKAKAEAESAKVQKEREDAGKMLGEMMEDV